MRKLESAISDAASTNTKLMHDSTRLIVSRVCTRKRGKYQEVRCAMLTGVLAVPRSTTPRPAFLLLPPRHIVTAYPRSITEGTVTDVAGAPTRPRASFSQLHPHAITALLNSATAPEQNERSDASLVNRDVSFQSVPSPNPGNILSRSSKAP